MKKIDKLILASFMGPFILTFFVVIFILLSQFMLRYFDEIIGKDLGAEVVAQLIFYFSVFMTPNGFPLAVLLSSLMTFGNLGEHFELTAIKGAGISLIRTMAPIFVFSLLITVGAFHSNNHLVPKAALKAFSLLYDVKHKKPSMEIKEGAFYNGIDGYSIKVNEKLDDGQGLKDIIIYDHTKGSGNRDVILADSGRMYNIMNNRYLILELFNGQSYSEQKPDRKTVRVGRPIPEPFVRNRFASAKIAFNMSSFDLKRTKEELFAGNRMMKNTSQLVADVDSMDREASKMVFEIKDNLYQNFKYHLKDVRDVHRLERNEFYQQFVKEGEEEESDAPKPTSSDTTKKPVDKLISKDTTGKPGSARVLRKRPPFGKKSGVNDASNRNQATKTGEASQANEALGEKIRSVRRAQLTDSVKKAKAGNRPLPISDTLKTYNLMVVESQHDGVNAADKVKTWEETMAVVDSIMDTEMVINTAFQKSLTRARHAKSNLSVQGKRLDHMHREINTFKHERYKKLSNAVTIIIMFLIGAPLGSIIKRGGLGVPVIISIAFFILYYVISMVTEKYVKQNLVDPLVGAWMANIWLLPVGLFFLRQARNDARLLDLDFYHVAFLKLEQYFRSVKSRILPG
jgi:lipopolysaccharide export system permease protein